MKTDNHLGFAAREKVWTLRNDGGKIRRVGGTAANMANPRVAL